MAEPPTDPARLLAAARGGSREAMGEALELCRQYLLAVANRQLNPALRAKGGPSDLVQQTFLEAQRDFDRFHGASLDELQAWLKQMLLHNAADFARGFLETDKRRADREVGLPDADTTGEVDDLASDTPTPSAHAMVGEQEEKVRRALDTLPADYRQVVVWRYQEELSFAEIAQRMGRTENAVRKLWFRAVMKLEETMGGSLDGA
ncbi:MAG TPA: sigma-70 family RNA polymerase sigma factor [Gemmataceae bacterium]|nr:sigma-70 family RNA polymerase sigma factor [Gemmataceae bacterium]